MNLVSIVITIIASIFLLIIILLIIFNYLFFRLFKKRNDGDQRYKFLSLKDYPGLKQEAVSINSVYKVKLNGGIFSYKKDKYHGVIIFYHGFLCGYLNYLNVINYFAKAGFIVVAFDMYGNMSSEGKNMKGFPVGDKDNREIINFVKHNPKLNKYPLFTLGHSWGAHVALTSLIHDDTTIKKAVALSPFNSNSDVVCSTSGILTIFLPLFYLLNLFKFGHEGTYSVTSALKYTNADVLIYCGGLDHIVKPRYSYNKYQRVVHNKALDHVQIKCLDDRGHFIYLSPRSEQYFIKEISFPRKTPIDFEHLDYSLVNELDENRLKEIVNFLLK